MIKLKGISKTNIENKKLHVIASLYADTKEEVMDSIEAKDVEGMDRDCVITAGSIITTADFEVANLDSNGHWHWMGEE